MDTIDREQAIEKFKKGGLIMFGFVSKKRLYTEIQRLYKENDTANAYSKENLFFRMGCANVCNALCSRLKLPQPYKGAEVVQDEN